MNADERRIYASFQELISKVDPANLGDYTNEGALPYRGVEEGHYYVVKVGGYPPVEPNRPHGEPHVENEALGYRYFMIYITEINLWPTEITWASGRSGVGYMVESFKNVPDSTGSRYEVFAVYSNTEVNQPYYVNNSVWDSKVWGNVVSKGDVLWWDITSKVPRDIFLNWPQENPLEVKS